MIEVRRKTGIMTRFGIKQFSLIVVAMLMCAGCSGTDNTKDSPVNVSTAETAQESASDDTSATSLIGDIPTTQAFFG